MACSACARRRKAWQAKQQAKREAGKTVQAAAIGAAMAVTGAVGKAIHGEVGDERDRDGSEGAEPDSGSDPSER